MTPLAFIAKVAMAKHAEGEGIDWGRLWNDHKAKIIGGGIGALGGTAAGFLTRPGDEDPESQRNWADPVLGGLAGAALGVGGGYGWDALGGSDGIKNKLGFGPAAKAPKERVFTGRRGLRGHVGDASATTLGAGAGFGVGHALRDTMPRVSKYTGGRAGMAGIGAILAQLASRAGIDNESVMR